MKWFTTLVLGVGVALLTTGTSVAGPQTLVTQASFQVPKTHSQELRARMTSPQSDSSDRTFDYLARVEKTQFEVNLRVQNLRKILAYRPDEATQQKLDGYVALQNDLSAIHINVEALQKSIGEGIAHWTKAEDVAAAGETVDSQRYAKIGKSSADARSALKSFDEAVARVQSQAARLNDKKIENLAGYLSGEAKVMDDVVAMTAEPTGTRRAAAPAASEPTSHGAPAE